MQITELLEQDKQRIRAAFAEADTEEKMQGALEKEWDRLKYRYLEGTESAALRIAASGMIETAKAAGSFVDSDGEAQIWERTASGGSVPSGKGKKADEKKKGSAAGVFGAILLLAGILCAGGAAFLLWLKMPDLIRQQFAQAALALAGGGLLAVFLAGILLNHKSKKEYEPQREVRIRPDADKCFRAMRTTALMIDRQLADTAEEEKKLERERRESALGAISKEEIELYSELMTAAYSGDAEYTMDVMADVRHFLHKKNIEAVDYDKEHENWFDLMPSEKSGTIRPALASDGKLLKKGLAAQQI